MVRKGDPKHGRLTHQLPGQTVPIPRTESCNFEPDDGFAQDEAE